MSEQSAYFIPGKVTEEGGHIYRNYHPTQHTESPWGPGFQHGSPPAALIATVLEDGARDAGMSLEEGRFSRMTVEILGAVPLSELRTHARVVRPGKRISFLEAVVTDESGREFVRGSGWWIRRGDTQDIERTVGEPMPGPVGAEDGTDFLERWASGYIDSIDARKAHLEQHQLEVAEKRNPAIYWSRTDLPAVEGKEDSNWVRLMKTVDIANGLNNLLDTDKWTYMNVDTTVYLHHEMRGEWLGLSAEANYGTDGIGTTVTRIYDEQGLIGTCNQGIMLAPR
ncbi:thioesterase family protein [Corynebacterium macclintockiae]|uniref:thioesterase family protein n=1 Tax=Corynebacterium macclintockiae TaxID=2913501 RepID=UPI003EB9227C